ncbi:MAG: T9SS type A sorting domain-containing protein [Saprospiraceae bacterium]
MNPSENYTGRFLNPEVSYDGKDFVFSPTRPGVFQLEYTDFDTCGSVVTRTLSIIDAPNGTNVNNYLPYDCTSLQAGSIDIIVGAGVTVREYESGTWYTQSTSSSLLRYDENVYQVSVGQQECEFVLPVSGGGPTTAVTSLTYDCDASTGFPTISVTGNPTDVQYSRYFQDDNDLFRFQGLETNVFGPAEVNGFFYYTDGCRTPYSESIPSSPAPKVDSGTDFDLSCGRDSFYIPTSTLAEGPAIQYEWTTNDGLIRNYADSSRVLVGSAGTYKVTISNTVSECANSDFTIVGQSQNYTRRIRDTLCSGVTSYQAIDTVLSVPGTYTVPGTIGQCDTLLRYVLSNRQPLVITVSTTAADNSMLGSADVSANGVGSIASILWSTGETGAQVSGLAAGSYSVTVTDNFGCSSVTDFDIEFVSSSTNVLASTWKMYPNPSTGIIQLELDNKHPDLHVEVYTLAGQLVRRTTLAKHRNSLDLMQLAKGVYGVRLVDRQGIDYGIRLLTIE